jgi:hypothetical protein
MSIDMDQDSECLEGNSRAPSSGSLHLVVGVGAEVIAALDPDEAKYWIFHLSDDVSAAIEAWNAAPVVIEGNSHARRQTRAGVTEDR